MAKDIEQRIGFYIFGWLTTFVAAIAGSELEFEILNEGFIALFINLFSNIPISVMIWLAAVLVVELIFT